MFHVQLDFGKFLLKSKFFYVLEFSASAIKLFHLLLFGYFFKKKGIFHPNINWILIFFQSNSHVIYIPFKAMYMYYTDYTKLFEVGIFPIHMYEVY